MVPAYADWAGGRQADLITRAEHFKLDALPSRLHLVNLLHLIDWFVRCAIRNGVEKRCEREMAI